ADVLSRRRDDVEIRRSAEVDDDRGSPVTIEGRDRVRDPVRSHLARIVVSDRDTGSRARSQHEQRCSDLHGELLIGADERGHRRCEAEAIEGVEIKQSPEEEPELIPGSLRLGRESPAPRQLAAFEQPERRLGVSDVDCEQAGHGENEAIPLESQRRWPSCASGAGDGGLARSTKRRRMHAATANAAPKSSWCACRPGGPATWPSSVRARICDGASKSGSSSATAKLPSALRVLVGGKRLADPLGEILRGQAGLIALATELLDRHVA